jgi:hypothetical protein
MVYMKTSTRDAALMGTGALRRCARATFLVAVLALFATPASARADTLTFRPVADAYVNQGLPNTSYGTSTGAWVDGSPTCRTYLRFDVSGIGDSPIRSAKLRLYQRDASVEGGRVSGVSSTDWTEAITWNTRPAIDGPAVGSFGGVASGRWYEIDVTHLVQGEGAVSVGLDSTNGDGALWSSRESGATAPELVVEVDSAPVRDGVLEVAPPTVGSSEPTYFPTNRRLALTSGGRLLAVHGKHASGVQLAWRNPSGTWQTATTGATGSGALLSGTGTGDWAASIAVARDAAGAEHAWVVWGGPWAEKSAPVQMVRLSNLDDPAGPTVGPTITIDGAGFKPDIAFERTPSGESRGAVVWSKQTATNTVALNVSWFTELANDTPAIHDRATLFTSGSLARYGTLVPVQGGMRVSTKGKSDLARVFAHAVDASLTSWTEGASGGVRVPPAAYPAAAALSSGELLAAVETDTTTHVVTVQRFSAAGVPAPKEFEAAGYRRPSIATDGTNAWVVMERVADGALVSRAFTPATGWAPADTVEIGPDDDVTYSWPNVLRETDGRLRLLAAGRAALGGASHAVLSFQRRP